MVRETRKNSLCGVNFELVSRVVKRRVLLPGVGGTWCIVHDTNSVVLLTVVVDTDVTGVSTPTSTVGAMTVTL